MGPTSIDPHLIVVFGATGDLFHRKLLPALFRLLERGVIDGRFRVLGVARRGDLDDASFRGLCERSLDQAGLTSREAARAAFVAALDYAQVQDGVAASYQALAERIAAIEDQHSLPHHRIFYLSLPPQAFPSTIEGLGAVGLNRSEGTTRLVIEKPFGRDLASAKALNQLLHRWFGLPDRSLPREGDRPEPDGAALRQRAVRAAVARRAHRSRADHGGRESLGVEAAPATTTRPARCATWCRTTCCSCCASSRWSRPASSRPTRARREAEGAPALDRADAERSRRPSCAASTAPVPRTAGPCRATRTNSAHRAAPRPSSR
jgi:hypothetical protein